MGQIKKIAGGQHRGFLPSENNRKIDLTTIHRKMGFVNS